MYAKETYMPANTYSPVSTDGATTSMTPPYLDSICTPSELTTIARNGTDISAINTPRRVAPLLVRIKLIEPA